MSKRFRGIAIGGVIILLIAQSLGALLSLSSFEKSYRETLVSKYRILLEEVRRQVERDLNFGKPIHRLTGVPEIFDAVIAQDLRITEMSISEPGRFILYSSDTDTIGMRPAIEGVPAFSGITSSSGSAMVTEVNFHDSIYLALPIHYDSTQIVGIVYLGFAEQIVTNQSREAARETIRVFIPILVLSGIVLAILLTLIEKAVEQNIIKLPTATLGTLAIGTVLLFAEAGSAFLNNHYFEQEYVALFRENTGTLAKVIKGDLDRILSFGVRIERMKDAELVLDRYRIRTPETERIAITDSSGQVLYSAGPEGIFSILSNSDPDTAPPGKKTMLPILPDNIHQVLPLGMKSTSRGYLAITLNQGLITAKLRDNNFDALTILAVSLVFGFELVRMLSVFMSDRTVSRSTPKTGQPLTEEAAAKNLQIVRGVAFIFFFAALAPLSFLPAFIDQIHIAAPHLIPGMSRDAIIGLPLTAYLLGVTIFIPLVGHLSTKLTTRRLFFFSGSFFLAGTVGSMLSTAIPGLSVARLLTGMGYGGMLVGGSNLVVASTTDNNRSAGFGSWSAGFAAASICAISVGGMIVNRLGYRAGILLSVVATVAMLIFIVAFVEVDTPRIPTQGARKAGLRSILRIFRNRSLMANLIFSSIPFSLAYVGVFQYILPLYMDREGISAANIGRLLTVYGLISLATPLVSRMADRRKNEKSIIIAGNLITAVSLLTFFSVSGISGISQSYMLIIVVLFGMGFGGMMIDASEESFLTASREASELGEANLLSLYTTVEKISTVLVPVVVGLLATSLGYAGSIGIIGLLTLAGAGLFALLAKNLRSQTK